MTEHTQDFSLAAARWLSGPRSSHADALFAARWPVATLGAQLRSVDTLCVRLACAALAQFGTMAETPALALLLGHADAAIVADAESALWNIWMLAAGGAALEELRCAMALLDAAPQRALHALTAIAARRPDFAEAHHQLAIARHAGGDLIAAGEAYARAVRLNPLHYPAIAACGHVAVERGEWAEAVVHYRRALRIHPGLVEISALLPQLDEALARRVVA